MIEVSGYVSNEKLAIAQVRLKYRKMQNFIPEIIIIN